MRVLSIDVGICNLAYCVLERAPDQTPRILAWRLLSFAKGTMADTVRALYDLLKEHAQEFEGCTDILIERQAGLNKRMVCISHALQMHFLGRKRRVHFCDPRGKLRAFAGEEPPAKLPKGKYACTKALGRFHVQAAVAGDERWSAFLAGAAKKDDLAVSL